MGRLTRKRDLALEFELGGAQLDEAIKSHGAMPLPPYIGAKRAVEERDKVDYQTVYAAEDGAVAAPTAMGSARRSSPKTGP